MRTKEYFELRILWPCPAEDKQAGQKYSLIDFQSREADKKLRLVHTAKLLSIMCFWIKDTVSTDILPNENIRSSSQRVQYFYIGQKYWLSLWGSQTQVAVRGQPKLMNCEFVSFRE